MSGSVASNSTLALAARTGTLGVGFSGSGFLIFYFTGVTAVLQQLGIIKPSTRLAGTSGGSANAAAACAGVPPQRQYDLLLRMATHCRNNGSCSGYLDKQVEQTLRDVLDDKSAAKCRDRLWVSVTAVMPGGLPDGPKLLGSKWNSTQELTTAVRASSFIPGISGPGAALRLTNGGEAYDGGYTTPLPCPPGVTYCVRVSSSPVDPQARPTATEAGSRLPLNNKNAAPDIAPGLGKPLPVKAEAWRDFSLFIPSDDTLAAVYETGRTDAAFWATRNGLASPQQATQALQATKLKTK